MYPGYRDGRNTHRRNMGWVVAVTLFTACVAAAILATIIATGSLGSYTGVQTAPSRDAAKSTTDGGARAWYMERVSFHDCPPVGGFRLTTCADNDGDGVCGEGDTDVKSETMCYLESNVVVLEAPLEVYVVGNGA